MTEEQKLHMDALSFILGKAHGGIANILNMPDSIMRENLKKLFDALNDDVARIFYSNPNDLN